MGITLSGTSGRGLAGAAACAVLVLIAIMIFASGQVSAQPAARTGIHLGVASCAGNNCHGAVQPLKGVAILQNEYLIWSQKDKHHLAYKALLDPRGRRIARNLGLSDAAHAKVCLDCHADNVAPDKRGRQFNIADGVGCESCHGAAEGWLGVHLSGAGHKANLAAGLYPLEQPLARAKICLSCHFGNDKKFVTHRMMGAGHPPMPFELDTYTAIEPAHFVVNKSYIERIGHPNDAQIWAVGQAYDLAVRMDALIDAKNAPHGVDPELVLFDCQSCHHGTKQLQWQKSRATGLGPGRLKLYDADAIMLTVVADRIAPAAGKALREHMLALQRATTEDWSKVQSEGKAVRQAVDQLMPALVTHDFTQDDMKVLAAGVINVALTGDDTAYSTAQQSTMALESIVSAMKSFGYLDEAQLDRANTALKGLYAAVEDDQTYRPDTFIAALKNFQAAIPK